MLDIKVGDRTLPCALVRGDVVMFLMTMRYRRLNHRRSGRVVRLVLVLLAASFNVRAELLPLKAYTVAEGLAHNEINRIVRDSRGFLWFCTGEGLSRFDGYSFTNYTTDHGLPHRNVTNFLETREGEFWLGTNGGLVSPRRLHEGRARWRAPDVHGRRARRRRPAGQSLHRDNRRARRHDLVRDFERDVPAGADE